MFPNFNKKLDKKDIDKNLKMMGISSSILIGLFAYSMIKSDISLEGTSYYLGVGFLFVLLFITLALQKYKNKVREMIPKNKFQEELEKSTSKDIDKEDENSDISNKIEAVNSNISFKDVAGISEIKSELQEVVDFLNNPKKYKEFDVQLPKGVLLVGPPGVGKTLIARAVAGEANVPFFYQSGASFVHIYVGMGAKKVRELFTVAKSKAPSIIFIDEIDAVGKSRGVGGNDEREATLNELLTQMDGFDGTSGVMVIAATNKIEVLDEALLRAGRFDRRIFLKNPSKSDRLEILKHYLKDKQYTFDLDILASDTSGFSSSALSTLVNEALLNMIKSENKTLSQYDIDIAKQKLQFGKKETVVLTDEQKDILATYQAGKSFVSKKSIKLFDEDIINQELLYPSKKELEKQIDIYLAGSIALEVIKNESYVVFEKDITTAYKIANDMVDIYKMENNIENIIKNSKNNLKSIITQNKDNILKLKDSL
ncbi:MAG: AAA family ATPase, partial [Campylobacterota bacterium]|nr:AAA family ATPase [Campylobacterota bacterium]